MAIYNVIQYTFPDGSHRWKYFTYAQEVGTTREPCLDPVTSVPVHEPGWTIQRKELENARRAKQSVYELARSNVDRWDWFATFTFDPDFVERDNYYDCLEHLRRYCKRLTARGCSWLFVPEHHKDGRAYHFHGLIGGEMELSYAGNFGNVGRKRPTYNVPDFPGFTAVQPITDSRAVCTYITKYITKDLVHLVPKGCHRYLRSRDLLEPEVSYFAMTAPEFTAMFNYGEYFPESRFEDGLKAARFVKKIPVYYTLNKECMYIVED